MFSAGFQTSINDQQSTIINPIDVAGRDKTITTRNPTILLSIILPILTTLVLSPGDSFAIDILSEKNLIENEEIPWEITAKTLSYDEKKGIYVAEGDVIISKESVRKIMIKHSLHTPKKRKETKIYQRRKRRSCFV